MTDNSAAWLMAKHGRLEVKPAPYTHPQGHEIVVRTHAVGINPVDWIKPLTGDLMFGWVKYPCVLGSDVAGEVVEVGEGVTRFRVGDRVVGHALGLSQARNSAAEGAFQSTVVLVDHMTAPIPASMTYESAAVLPLGISTAACGLFQEDYLALQYPSASANPTGKSVLVWGGSTSVGSNAIQLAVAAGYEVITTASPRNFAYVTSLGASLAFDYNDEAAVSRIIAALAGKRLAGALAIGQGSAQPCLDIVHACEGDKVVATASAPVNFDGLPEAGGPSLGFLTLILGFARSNLSMAVKARTRGIRTKFIFGDSLADNEVGPMIWVDFLPAALADGRYRAAPEPLIAGDGLGAVQSGLKLQREGVSARKVVVRL